MINQRTFISIPDVTGMNACEAALSYAAAGLFVGPLLPRSKNPGMILGRDWPDLTSRDPEVIQSWYLNQSDWGVFLHAGKSGLLIFDVDTEDVNLIPEILRQALAIRPPAQSTRTGALIRGHYLFTNPPGRTFGNGLGGLAPTAGADKWGEIRGKNGVIVVAPSIHEDEADGGAYRWFETGAVPVLPDPVAELLSEAVNAAPSASAETVRDFLATHTSHLYPARLQAHVQDVLVASQGSRHGSCQNALTFAFRDAADGYLSAQVAVDQIREAFDKVKSPSEQGRGEFDGLVAWAVSNAARPANGPVAGFSPETMISGLPEGTVEGFGSPQAAPTDVRDMPYASAEEAVEAIGSMSSADDRFNAMLQLASAIAHRPDHDMTMRRFRPALETLTVDGKRVFTRGDFNKAVAGARAEIRKQVTAQKFSNADLLKMPSPSDPAESARFVENYLDQQGSPLLVSDDEWYRYEVGKYVRQDDNKIKSILYRTTEHATYGGDEGTTLWSPNRTSIRDLMEALGRLTDVFAVPGSWVGDPGERPDTGPLLVPVRDGVLDVRAGAVIPHDSRWFFTHQLPFTYDPQAQCPVWLQTLEAQWGDQPLTMQAIQEWFGYVLSGRTDLQKAALLYGPRRSAKGLIARILQTLLGAGGQALRLSSFVSEFGLSGVIDAPLAVLGDVRWTGVEGVSQAVSRILEITGEDQITVPRKFKLPWSGRLPTRLMFMSNDEPSLPDSSGALASRMLIFSTVTSYLGREDSTLEERIRGELAGVLNWALGGLSRLEANGRFTEPEGAAESQAEMTAAGSPVVGFIRDRCVLDPDSEAMLPDLYREFRAWCGQQHIDRPMDQPRFSQRIRSAIPQPSARKRATVAGQKVTVVQGVKLATAEQMKPQDVQEALRALGNPFPSPN